MSPRSTSSGQASTPLRTGSVIAALDRLDHIASCMEAVSDLLIPETDLHVVNRDKLALLSSFLLVEHRIAQDQLAKALNSGKVTAIRPAG